LTAQYSQINEEESSNASQNSNYLAYDSKRAQDITKAIAVMIAADFQPFSMVMDKGFRHLMNLFEPRYKIPDRKSSLLR